MAKISRGTANDIIRDNPFLPSGLQKLLRMAEEYYNNYYYTNE